MLAALRLLICIWALIGLDPAGALNSEQDAVLLSAAPGWTFSGASLDMDFANSRYWSLNPSQLTVSRASSESEVCNGQLYTFNTNQPAITPGCGLWVWEARTNGVLNNAMAGASAGVLPTNWSIIQNGQTGITTTVLGTSVINGMTFVNINFSGTPSANGNIQILFDGSALSAGSYGQTFTESLYYYLSGGSTTNVSAVQALIQEYTSGGSYISSNSVSLSLPTASITRGAYSFTSHSPTTGNVSPSLLVVDTSGQPINMTMSIAAPQLELNPNLSATVASAAMAASGSGGVNGTAIYTVTGGTCATIPKLNVTWASGTLTVNSVSNAGSCSVLPPSPATLAYSSGTATGWTGATVNLTPTNNAALGFATSPILTSGSAATRSLSVINLPASYISRFNFPNPETFYVKFTSGATLQTGNYYALDVLDANVDADFLFESTTAAAAASMNNYVTGVAQAAVPSTLAFSSGATIGVAAAFNAYDRAIYVNGGNSATNTTGSGRGTGGATGFILGSNTVSPINGSIQRLAWWPNSRLPNSTLQSLSAK